MPHLGGKQSVLSSALSNVRRQLNSGKTRGQNPRDLEPDELSALERQRDILEAEMKNNANERALARINAHTTTEADRVIHAVQEASKPASAYFDAIGGAGSSTDLRLQGKALIERVKDMDRAEKRRHAAQRKVAARAEKADQKDRQKVEKQCVAPCLISSPWGNAGFRRKQGASDFVAVRDLVEEYCAGSTWIKQEQAPHVSDFLAHLAAASFAAPGRCEQTPAGYDSHSQATR